MAVELGYTIDLDHGVWIPVPLGFPWNGHDSDTTWAAELAASLLEGVSSDRSMRDDLARTALLRARTTGPLPGAHERFWHFPEFGGPDRLVHLYVAEYPAPGGQALGQFTEVARSGMGGFVQVLESLDDTPFERAVRAVVVTSAGEGSFAHTESGDAASTPIYAARYLGFAGGLVFIIELVDDDALTLGDMLEPTETLFRSIRLRRV